MIRNNDSGQVNSWMFEDEHVEDYSNKSTATHKHRFPVSISCEEDDLRVHEASSKSFRLPPVEE